MIEIRRNAKNPIETAQNRPESRLNDQMRNSPPPVQPPQKGQKNAFYDVSGERNYNHMYRIAHDFHERHNPPRQDLEYWTEAAEDMAETATRGGNDPFLVDLLTMIYTELSRECDKMKETTSTQIENAS